MDPYTASKFDLHEALRPDDRAAEARYELMKHHKCKRDRIATKTTIAENRFDDHVKLVPLMKKIPCCVECYLFYYQHEEPGIELHGTPVIDLHPNRAA